MQIDKDKLKKVCSDRGVSISEMLDQAGVSRNAYYSLLRKKNILPKSVTAVVKSLGLEESDLLTATQSPEDRIRHLYSDMERIVNQHAINEPDNVRLTLQLLDKKPIERLRTALTRGRQFNFH